MDDNFDVEMENRNGVFQRKEITNESHIRGVDCTLYIFDELGPDPGMDQRRSRSIDGTGLKGTVGCDASMVDGSPTSGVRGADLSRPTTVGHCALFPWRWTVRSIFDVAAAGLSRRLRPWRVPTH